MTTFVTLVILSADYFCLVSYISSNGHFSEVYLVMRLLAFRSATSKSLFCGSKVYLNCLVTALKSLLDVLCCRVTALDK